MRVYQFRHPGTGGRGSYMDVGGGVNVPGPFPRGRPVQGGGRRFSRP